MQHRDGHVRCARDRRSKSIYERVARDLNRTDEIPHGPPRDLQAFAGDEQGDVGHRAVAEARQALRAALIAKLNTSPSAAELQRVSDVLKRATDELRRVKQ
ncbi:MAG: hypothetical protein E6H69_01135 [Betaproteobacteria bacterium]|nr:MAG: hypothetical protein E6H69_01135 [Betaproteobacteria bacterium]